MRASLRSRPGSLNRPDSWCPPVSYRCCHWNVLVGGTGTYLLITPQPEAFDTSMFSFFKHHLIVPIGVNCSHPTAPRRCHTAFCRTCPTERVCFKRYCQWFLESNHQEVSRNVVHVKEKGEYAAVQIKKLISDGQKSKRRGKMELGRYFQGLWVFGLTGCRPFQYERIWDFFFPLVCHQRIVFLPPGPEVEASPVSSN